MLEGGSKRVCTPPVGALGGGSVVERDVVGLGSTTAIGVRVVGELLLAGWSDTSRDGVSSEAFVG